MVVVGCPANPQRFVVIRGAAAGTRQRAVCPRSRCNIRATAGPVGPPRAAGVWSGLQSAHGHHNCCKLPWL